MRKKTCVCPLTSYEPRKHSVRQGKWGGGAVNRRITAQYLFIVVDKTWPPFLLNHFTLNHFKHLHFARVIKLNSITITDQFKIYKLLLSLLSTL